MAKLTLPPYLKELCGACNNGETVFRRTPNGVCVETNPAPSYTRSPAQASQRDTYSECVQYWNSLTPEQRAAYEQAAREDHLTPFNEFMSECLIAGGPYTEKTVNLTPIADTWSYQRETSTNYGSQTSLNLQNYTTYLMYAYIKFDLSQLGDVVELYDATLYLYRYNSYRYAAGNYIEVLEVEEEWHEDTLTWGNQPAEATKVASTEDPNAYQWVQWDLTTAVQRILNGDYPNRGWTLRLNPREITGGTYPQFYSREAASNQPYLKVHYLKANL